MDLNNLPPLLLSEAGPIKLGSKHAPLIKLQPTYENGKYGDISHSVSLDYQELNEVEGTGVADNDHIKDWNLKEDQRLSNSLCEPENNASCSIAMEDLTTGGLGLSRGLYSSCCLKRCQCCYTVVRKDYKKSPQSEALLFGSNSTLPGVVDIDELCATPAHRKQAFSSRVSRFWNAKLQLSHSKQSEKFVEYCQHFLMQIQKFITKLRKAYKEELKYIMKLEKNIPKHKTVTKDYQSDFVSRNSRYNTDASNYFNSDDENSFPNELSYVRPVKLGKVYAELQMHFKAWSDIMEKWQASRHGIDPEMLQFLTDTFKRIKNYQSEMLLLTEDLITARLNSFAYCVTKYSSNDDSEREWDYILGTGSLKRLCKLIEVYNKLLRLQNGSRVQVSCSLQEGLARTKISDTSLLSQSRNTSLRLFDVSRILTILSGIVKEELAASLLDVLSLVHQPKQDSLNRLEQHIIGKTSNFSQFDWGTAYDCELDEDHVITHIAGFEVNNISNTELSNDNLSAIKQLLYAQGSFIVWFMNCLAANTSLLRSNMQSKSPRSVVSSQAFTDDVSAGSSDDEVSSVTSSIVISQFSGATNTPRKRKTVLWRDSWDQEAVKSSSKSYLASIVTEAPVETLLSRVVRPSLETKGMENRIRGHSSDSVSTRTLTKCFRPRFSSDPQTLIINANIMNMLALELLPDDVLQALQQSAQKFIIEKALESWDSSLCLALGTSTNDKCGSLPMDGQPSVTKTAWTYVKAIRTLMFIMDRYNKRDDVAQCALPRLQATLDSFHRWCFSKIQQFVASWKLRELMQVTLGDLSQLTQLALGSLPLVEKCHNYVECRRMESPGTLQQATRHLKNIDSIITNMQSLSGYCMKSYMKKCVNLSKASLDATFPSSKMWRQKNLTDHTSASHYIEATVQGVLAPICSSVSSLKPRSQLAAIPPAVSSILDAVIRLILDRNIRFSIQGTMQLQRDFDYVIDYVCSDEGGLCGEVRRAAPHASSVNRAMWVVSTLQRTDPTSKPTKTGYEKSKRRVHARSTATPDNLDDGRDDNDWTLKEKDFLALRAHVASGKEKKRWFTLPCYKETVD